MSNERVVVTGLGALTPYGIGVKTLWDGLKEARVPISKIKSFDTMGFNRDIGGEIQDFNPSEFIQKINSEDLPRTTQLAIAAAKMSFTDAGLSDNSHDLRVAVSFGSTMGNQSVVEELNDMLKSSCSTLDEIQSPPKYYPMINIARCVSQELSLNGPVMVFPTACAAGNYAISWGYDLIKLGHADVVISGGADAMSRGCYAIFNRLNAIATEKCQPFDKNRTGMIVSEGAGCLVLERESVARERGARIYAEMLGYGAASDAYHPTAPHPEGRGVIKAIKSCLDNISNDSCRVSYISSHGTGTKANDVTESKALRSVFGDKIDTIPVNSIKSMLGHTMGGASALGSVVCVKSIMHDIVVPTANYEVKDPECLTNIVPHRAIAHKVDTALNIGVGFGGNIAITAFGSMK
ncbi:beta-ketoacyl-[acyl-carrier-protein] synthase family protein [Fangia hongkongensis]|uniref:beta-ketoacyl-[acyl-carrier-protein] synthase family protein n=1 Tax=Fangia hongkongensis TaxID=270495 RepID=UPI00037FC3CE|nr:beta-ketoacyl-[acyl-carrier-protein] synthase family protein [Fangia hongkongensis]MBK2126365.1 beta-ketoacyl-[acyl-carrier-protein] synthase family protein [Fangia hongkongensis]